MRKIKWPKIGQYVLVTRWQDKDPNDPWCVGYVTEITIREKTISYKVRGSKREWYHCWKISEMEGNWWLGSYTVKNYNCRCSSLPSISD